jgi:hypothetical protein
MAEDFDQENPAGFVEDEQVDLEESQETTRPDNLLAYDPMEVKEMLHYGTVTADQVEQYVAYKDMKKNGPRAMKASSVKTLLNMGLFSEDQTETFIDYNKSPKWWTAKDIGKAAINGVINFGQFMGDAAHAMSFEGILRGEGLPEALKTKAHKYLETKLRGPETLPKFDDPESTVGKIVEVGVEFLIPFGVARKTIQVMKLVPGLISKFPRIAGQFPKAAKFIEYTMGDTIAGAAADATFDPYGGRASDLFIEHGIMPEFLEFLQTNPDNPEYIERFKNVLEGAGLGLAIDGILFGSKLLKKFIWEKSMMDSMKVADEVTEKFGLFMSLKEQRAKPKKVKTTVERFQEAGVPDETIEAGRAVPEEAIRPEVTLKNITSAFDALKDIKADIAGEAVEVGSQAGSIARLMEEAGGNTAMVAKHVYQNSEDMIDIARGGPVRYDKQGKPFRKSRKETQKGSENVLKGFARAAQKTEKTMQIQMLSEMEKFGVATGKMDEVVRAFDQYFVQYADEVGAMAKQIVDPKTATSFTDELKVLEHLKVLQEMQSHVLGIRSDIGRTLGQYNLDWMATRFDFDSLPTEAISDIAADRAHEVRNIVNSFAKAKKHGDKLKIARYTGRNKWLAGTLEFMQSNLLWNPGTQLVNLIGNMSTQLYDGMLRHFAVTADAIISGDMGRMLELVEFYKGIGTGISTCFKIKGLAKWASDTTKANWKNVEFGRVFKAFSTGEGQLDQMVKLEGQLGGGMEAMAEALHLPKILSMPIIRTIQLPFHALTAGDEIFKNIGYFSELNSLVFREGRKLGKKGDDFKLWAKTVMEDVPADLHYEALNRARYLTFQDDFGTGTITKKMNEALNTNYGMVVKIGAIPFFKIAVNITKYAGQHSALGLLGNKFWADWAAGGVKRYEAIGRITTGSAIMLGAAQLYDAQLIVGRVPPGQQDAWNQADIQPYSFRYGDKWYSYDRFDPFGMLLGAAADIGLLQDIYKYNENVPKDMELDLLTNLILTMSEPVLNKTWMTGVGDILNLILQADRTNPSKQAIKQLEKFFPGTTGFEWFQQNFNDTHIRELNKVSDILWKKIDPKRLIAKRHNVYGHEIQRDPRLGYVVKVRSMDDDVMVEMANVQANMKKISDKVGGVQLEPEEYAKLNDIVAQMPIREILAEVINSQEYQSIQSHPLKAEMLKGIVNNMRGAARGIYISGSTEVQEDIIERAKRDAYNIVFATAENNAVKALYHQFNIKGE